MAVRKLLINDGQSNAGPWHDIGTWLQKRLDLNLLGSSNRVGGAYSPSFTMPGVWPGFNTTRPLKGLAISNIRYLTFWNPSQTGYSSYPGTTRTPVLDNGAANTTTTLWVEAMFEPGTQQVASLHRKLNGKDYVVAEVGRPHGSSSVITSSWLGASSTHFGTGGHGLLSGDALVMSDSSGPTEVPNGTYYALVVDPNTFAVATSVGGTPIAVAGSPGANAHFTVSAISAPTRGGSRIRLTAAMLDPMPQLDEEFTFAITATGTAAQLNVNFGVLKQTTASLLGVQLRVVSGAGAGAKRIIGEWNPTTRTPTLYNITTGVAEPLTTAAGSVIVLEPQGDVAWDRWCYFLPWCMFETDLVESAGPLGVGVLGKVNPYPPGFNYPNQFHVPQLYSTDVQTPTAAANTGGLLMLTVLPNIAWHTSFLVRLSEFYGEEVWCISCDFGGTSSTHVEPQIGQENIGWYDQAQQTDWAMGRANSCFQRLLDELDAAIAAAALVGDTLEVVLHTRNQGFADATSGSDPTYGPIEGQSSMPADKFLEVNRAFRARVRLEITNRGLWPKTAPEIPWVQPLEQEESVDLAIIGDAASLKKVNDALRQLADEDDYAETWDQTGLETGPDGIHFTGAEVGTRAEDATFGAFQKILRRSDRSGDVAICNRALSNIGETARITSINPPDGSLQAALCAQYYDRCRDALLEAHQWGFATKRRALSVIDTQSSVYAYAYFRPSDCMRIVEVLAPDAIDDNVQTVPRQRYYGAQPSVLSEPAGQKQKEEQLEDGTRVIYTNQQDAVLRYVSRVTDARLFSAKFADALEARLSSKLAPVIIKGDIGVEEGRRWEQMVQYHLSSAAELDSNQEEDKPEHIPAWIAGMD